MNRYGMIAMTMLLGCFGVAQPATYTLDDLLKAGISNSKQIKVQAEAIKKAAAQVSEAYGSAMPSLNLTANYSYALERYNQIATMNTSGDFGSFGDALKNAHIDSTTEKGAYLLGYGLDGMFSKLTSVFIDNRPNTFSTTLTLNQTLYAQGKVGLGLKAARIFKENAQTQYQATVQNVKAAIIKEFYGALLAQKNVASEKEAIALSLDMHKLAVLKFQIGKGSELDTLTSRYNYEKALIDLQSAESMRTTQYVSLIKESGISADARSFDVNGEFPQPTYSIMVEDALAKTHSANLTIAQMSQTEKLQDISVAVAKSDFYPSVSCGASYGKIVPFQTLSEVDPQRNVYDDAKIFINASWNIFSGFSTTQKVKQAQADRSSYEQTKKRTIDQLDIAVINSCEQLTTARKQMESARALNQLAEKAYSVAKAGYELGQTSLIDMQSRKLDLENARLALNNAQYSYHSAVIDMQVLTGELN